VETQRRQQVLKLSLRAKFFLYSNAVIVGTMSLLAFLADVHNRGRAYSLMEQRTVQVTETLAILLGDTLGRGAQRPAETARYSARIDRYIEKVSAAERDAIRYITITNADGIVTHASPDTLVGRPLGPLVTCHACHGQIQATPLGGSLGSRAANASCACHDTSQPELSAEGLRARSRLAGGVGMTSRIVSPSSGERTFEVRMPLEAEGRWLGGLTVGFSLALVERRLAAIPRRLALVALLLILANSLLTAVYVETLIRPILRLNQIMKRAGGGDMAVRAPARRGDEVAELGAAFNRMMDELERARAQEKVHQTQLAHTEKMAAVGTLAAGVAHEVNNPLGGVLTCLENMRADPTNEEMRAKYLALIQSGVERIQHTVANLLGFSRQRPLNPEPTSINDRLRHVVELAAYQLRKAGVEVSFSLHPGDPRVTADRSQMEQLFLNLVLNALQAMPEGGTLTLQTGISEGQAFAEVRDTGRGIPPEIRDRIFDPFFTTRAVGRGTGLGLAVSDSIVAAHGGRIEVTSRVGVGSAFRVWLPRFEASIPEKA
jgi:two-component system NtrC family sensor kinase